MTAARTYRVFPTTESDFDLLTTAVGGDRRAAWALLNKYGSPAAIASSSPDELAKVSGLGPDRAAVLKAGLELGRRAALARPQERPRITKPDDAAALLMSRMRPERLKQEEFWVILLDFRHQVEDVYCLYRGCIDQIPIRVGEVFQRAVQRNGAAIIVAHNHPSGDPNPSLSDRFVTQDIVEAGKLLGIDCLDHLILTSSQWVSLREQGVGF
ncbi:MAG TPA: DNA repair protein RadC [Anaerolineales bacterium]|nr:DNA repair protein RadC [Anaerolineales bacterium]